VCFEVDLDHLRIVPLRSVLDRLHRSDLLGAHDLVLIEEKHRHTGCLQQLVDLESSGSQGSSREAIVGTDPDAVRLVRDEDVEIALFNRPELVEVAEEWPGRSSARLGTPAASSVACSGAQHHAPCQAPWTRTMVRGIRRSWHRTSPCTTGATAGSV
jgi:hypothetical protein